MNGSFRLTFKIVLLCCPAGGDRDEQVTCWIPGFTASPPGC